jgi:hypothetical protein
MRSRRLYVLAVCHRIGVHRVGPHKHNDWLSFELCVEGRPALIDPGTYCYTGQPELKALFRSTAYHNTVVVDGEEQLRFAPSSFALDRPHGDIRVLRWASDDQHVLLEAEHTGYTRLTHPIVHRRLFELDKRRDRLLITDSFIGEGAHSVEWFLHLDVGLTCRRGIVHDGARPLLAIVLPEGVEASVRPAWVSAAYNRRQEAASLTWQANTTPGERRHYEMTFAIPADT